jgi:3-mercaptopyruvate sulfurtransferase SseA
MPVPARFYRLVRILAAAMALPGLWGGLAGCDRKVKDTDIKVVSVSEVKLLVDRGERNSGEVLLIDPRPSKYYLHGHLPGARNIQLPQIDPKGTTDPGIARHNTIVVYGDDPGSAVARAMTKRLLAVGYDGVRFFAGGVKEWSKRYPMEPAAAPEGAAVETPAPGAAPESGAPSSGGPAEAPE